MFGIEGQAPRYSDSPCEPRVNYSQEIQHRLAERGLDVFVYGIRHGLAGLLTRWNSGIVSRIRFNR
jgi:hypothetical protein